MHYTTAKAYIDYNTTKGMPVYSLDVAFDKVRELLLSHAVRGRIIGSERYMFVVALTER